MTERAYFTLCRALGRLLRSTRYSNTRIVYEDGTQRVRKHRLFYAPLLLWMAGPLVRVLDAGVRVLSQRDWEQREREVYETVYGTSIRVDTDGMLVLPRVPGETLAALLENPRLDGSNRRRAIELAVVALAEFHSKGFTHGDASAENVIVDVEGGTAHWIDFEIIHDSKRPVAWRRADDVRALLATCVLRTDREDVAQTLDLIVDAYGDKKVTQTLAATFTTVMRRPLAFHLGQSPLSLEYLREIDRLLRSRVPMP